MRTVNYSEILFGSAALAGYGPADLGAPEFALFRTFHDRRLQVAWEIHRWPDLCPIEQRQFRPNWSATTTYGTAAPGTPNTDNSANEVYDPPTQQYYQSLIAVNTGNPPSINGNENSAFWAVEKTGYNANQWTPGTAYLVGNQVTDPVNWYTWQCITAHTSNSTFDGVIEQPNWGIVTPFNRYIAWAQAGQTAIGELFMATDKDPRMTTMLRRFGFMLSQLGAQFSVCTVAQPWIYYRIQRPVLTGNAYDPTVAYAAGAQMYYASVSGGAGNFYTATGTTAAGQNPVSNPSLWAVVALPYFLRGYLLEGGFVDWLMSDGQTEKAAALEPQAQAYLELEADKVQRQEQQVGRFTMCG
jgi:hypothetical protein